MAFLVSSSSGSSGNLDPPPITAAVWNQRGRLCSSLCNTQHGLNSEPGKTGVFVWASSALSKLPCFKIVSLLCAAASGVRSKWKDGLLIGGRGVFKISTIMSTIDVSSTAVVLFCVRRFGVGVGFICVPVWRFGREECWETSSSISTGLVVGFSVWLRVGGEVGRVCGPGFVFGRVCGPVVDCESGSDRGLVDAELRTNDLPRILSFACVSGVGLWVVCGKLGVWEGFCWFPSVVFLLFPIE